MLPAQQAYRVLEPCSAHLSPGLTALPLQSAWVSQRTNVYPSRVNPFWRTLTFWSVTPFCGSVLPPVAPLPS